MNRFNSLTKPLMWFMALLMVAFVAGCGGTTSSVDLPSVVSVSITPATPSIPISGIQQFTATATYSDGLTHNVTTAPGIAWSSASTGVATVSATGMATGVANGTSVITAAIGGKSATTNLTVTTATLVSIAVTPATPSIPVTTTQQFTAIASYTAGPVINVTAAPGMVWSSSTAGVATVSATGMATGVANGSAVITATYGGKTGTANLTVNPAILQSIAVTPATASVPAGLNQQFTATATYDYGPTVNVTTSASWTPGTAGATVGLHTGLAHGVTANVIPVVITASFGGKNATAALTVTAATVSSIAVTPLTPSIAISGTQQFTATATYSNTTTANVTAASGVVWTSSDPTKATIVSTTGLATGVAAGTANITAAFGGQTSPAATLTVTAATVNPTAPVLGEAGRFVILAYAGVTGDAACAISNGDMGITPAARTLMTGFTPSPNTSNPGGFVELTNGLSYAPEDSNTIVPTGYVIPYPYPLKYATVTIGTPWATTGAMLTQASSDETTAYNFLAADPNPSAPTTTLVSTELGGSTLTPGVYKTASSVTITTGALNLDAQGDPNAVWIFSIDGTLSTIGPAPSGNIVFVGGVGSAKNVYWRVAGATSIAANSTFIGNIFDQGTIAVLAGANVTGSLFSAAGSVTLISDTVTKP